ncbi:MAG: hypothetical protein GWO24_03465, partial [Akkermansiaceae bacterium]|nr:hypothetical protein [Akkermansiaceae bacterium]
MRNVPPVVGEVYSLYLRGSTRDDGTSSVWSGGGFLRAICVNLTTEDLKLNRKRTVHRGKRTGTTVREQIEATARALHAAFPAFGQRTEILAQTDASMLYETQHGTLREAIVAMVDSRPSLREAAAGIKRDALVQGLLINASAERDIDAPGSAAD